eukprot:387588-Pelagomonas_calceolata.AAC.8
MSISTACIRTCCEHQLQIAMCRLLCVWASLFPTFLMGMALVHFVISNKACLKDACEYLKVSKGQRKPLQASTGMLAQQRHTSRTECVELKSKHRRHQLAQPIVLLCSHLTVPLFDMSHNPGCIAPVAALRLQPSGERALVAALRGRGRLAWLIRLSVVTVIVTRADWLAGPSTTRR